MVVEGATFYTNFSRPLLDRGCCAEREREREREREKRRGERRPSQHENVVRYRALLTLIKTILAAAPLIFYTNRTLYRCKDTQQENFLSPLRSPKLGLIFMD